MSSHAPRSQAKLWLIRVAWFVALWCAGLAAVSALAYVLRLWIKAG